MANFIKSVEELEAHGFKKNEDGFGYSKEVNPSVKIELSSFPHNATTLQLHVIDANYLGDDQEEGDIPEGNYICALWNLNITSWAQLKTIEKAFQSAELDIPDVEYIDF